MENNDRQQKLSHVRWLIPLFLLAPIQLGAKGCDTGVVGSDAMGGAYGGGSTPSFGGSSSVMGGAAGTTSTGGSTSNGTACGGLTGAACAKGQYCKYSLDAQCGAADQTGICTAIPTACVTIYLPVCGCDGETYGNDCAAAAMGISIAAPGACGSVPTLGMACGGMSGAGCSVGEYCDYPTAAQCGAADQTGVCTAIPEACDMMYSPVCGCDDKTYGNACSAAAAGISVATTGECPATPPSETACGGLRGAGCPKGEYCNYPIAAQCGAADQTGVCAAIPEACDMMYSPVCGCDDKTYGNACSAAGAGISVATTGECPATPPSETACGGLRGAGCPKGEYCNYPIAAQCGAADQTGVCAPIPEVCTMQYAPVCGCDGKTYSNDCVAAGAGISVAANGACPQ